MPPATVSPRIHPRRIKELSRLSSSRWLAVVAMDWAVIAMAIIASERLAHPLVTLASLFVIAGRMHGLGVLMHEAAHFRVFKDRLLADRMADVLTAWPLFATVDGYRRNHLAHHQNANTPDDPDWMVKVGTAAFTFPQKLRHGLGHLAGYLIGINTVRDLRQILPRLAKGDRSTRAYKFARHGFYLLAAAFFTWLGIWREVLLYWVLPFGTLFFMFMYVRGVAEHFGDMDYAEELTSTRTVEPYFWERWFFAPHNINYHLEHHLYPSVPFHNLPTLHAEMMREPSFRDGAKVTRGYCTGLVRECFPRPTLAAR